jgi:hypothetical protein
MFFSWKRFLASLKSSTRKGYHRPKLAPRVEPLEDRCTPSGLPKGAIQISVSAGPAPILGYEFQGTVGTPWTNETLSAETRTSGGGYVANNDYEFSPAPGYKMPPGLQLTTGGVIQATTTGGGPKVAGQYNVPIVASDGGTYYDSTVYQFLISPQKSVGGTYSVSTTMKPLNALNQLQYNNQTLPLGIVDQSYNATVTGTNSTDPIESVQISTYRLVGSTPTITPITGGSTLGGVYVKEVVGGNTYLIYGLDGTSGPALKVSLNRGTDQVLVTGTMTGSAAGQSYPLFLSLTFLDETQKNLNFAFGYSPQEIESAYDFGNVGNGAGETIVILESGRIPNLVSSNDPNWANSDLNQFDQIFPGLNTFNQPGGPVFLKVNTTANIYTIPVGDSSELGGTDVTEEIQDIEWAHALAPMANIVDINEDATLYTNPTAFLTFLESQGLPAPANPSTWGFIVGTSGVGSPDSTQPSYVTYIDSSGDDLGSPPGAHPPDAAGNVLNTGYTQLTLSPGGVSRASESAVFGVFDPFRGSGKTPGEYLGSGGGDIGTTHESYQSGIYDQFTNQSINPITGRLAPDVTFNGSPESGDVEFNSAINSLIDDTKSPGGSNPDFGGGPWEDAWGTSITSPSWDALIAIANQRRAALGKPSLSGYTQTLPILYSLAGSTAFTRISTSVHNKSMGNLALSTSPIPGTYMSSTGGVYQSYGSGIYNTKAGLGSPVVDKLIPFLIGPTLTANTRLLPSTSTSFIITGTDFQPNANYSITFSGPVSAGTVTYLSPTTLLVSDLSGLSSLAPGTPLAATVQMTVLFGSPVGSATYTDTTGTAVQVGTVSNFAAPLSVQPLAFVTIGTEIMGNFLVRYEGPPATGTFELTFPTVPAGVSIVGQSEYQGTLQTGQQLLLQVDFTLSSAPYLDLLCKATSSDGTVLYPAALLVEP